MDPNNSGAGAAHAEATESGNSPDTSSPQQSRSDLEEASNGKKLDLLMKAFQSQLDMQERQLKLLESLLPPKKYESKQRNDLTKSEWTNHDERAHRWQRERISNTAKLNLLMRDFLDRCRERKLFWFSDLATHSNLGGAQTEPTNGFEEKAVVQIDTAEHILQKLQLLAPNFETRTLSDEVEWNMENGPDRILQFFWSNYNRRNGNLNYDVNTTYEGILARENLNPHGKGPAGRIIVITPGPNYIGQLRLPLDYAAFVLQQLSDIRPDKHDIDSQVLDFVISHLCERDQKASLTNMHPDEHPERFYSTHFQYFDIESFARKRAPFSLKHMNILREGGKFPDNTYLREKRMSFGLVSDRKCNLPCYSIVVMADSHFKIVYPDPLTAWAGYFASPLAFIRVITRGLDELSSSWERVLAALDKQIMVTVATIFDEEKSKELIFDDSTFARSIEYFRVQQLCRVFTSCIEETLKQLEFQHFYTVGLFGFLEAHCFYQGGIEPLVKKWNPIVEKRTARLEVILDRVRQKSQEVESLRDGLFNATSVKEAAQGTEMAKISGRQNQYIFIFTVATVIYLPLGFVTSIFGMPLFDSSDPIVLGARYKFWITMFVISFGTYAITATGYWFVRRRSKISKDKEMVVGADRVV